MTYSNAVLLFSKTSANSCLFFSIPLTHNLCSCCSIKLAFHDTDTDILADILVARMSACRSACHRNNFNRECRTRTRSCRRGFSRGFRCRCWRHGMRA